MHVISTRPDNNGLNLEVDNCTDVVKEFFVDGFVIVVIADQEVGEASKNGASSRLLRCYACLNRHR